MDLRREKIPIAHEKTFRWVFNAGSVDNTPWTDLMEWIQSESSIYWITGKAGSGKSTLMRFVHDHQSTRDALQAWAAEGELAIGSFFFWNSGAEIQMSYEGLLRVSNFAI
jgi:hypothetical protein